MTTLDDRLIRDLARLREGAGPPRGAEDRVLAALKSAIGPGGGDDGSGLDGTGLGSTGLGSTGLGKVAFGAKIVAATTACTSAGLLVIKLGAMAVHATSTREPTVEVVTPAASTAVPLSRPRVEPRIATDPAIPVTPRALEVRKPTAKPKEVDPLAAELALLEQARATSDLDARLELLGQHREQFESGVLRAERDALRISTLCELDRLTEAREAAEQFLIRHPRSPLLSRMRGACPTLDILAE